MIFRRIPIFIVKYKNPEVEARCLAALDEYVPDLKRYPRVVYDNSVPNRNLGELWNWLIGGKNRAAWKDYLWDEDPDPVGLLLNTDCFLKDADTLPKLEAVLRYQPEFGFAGPMTDHCGSVQCITHPAWGQGWSRKQYRDKVMVDQHISGFCLMFRRKAWEAAGGFPEDGPFYGQESALIHRAARLGWRTVIALDVFVEHLGGATCKQYLDQDAERQKGAAWFRAFREQDAQEANR